jgi:antitoxin component YwqK of YwqJK toxin-antitoxin module
MKSFKPNQNPVSMKALLPVFLLIFLLFFVGCNPSGNAGSEVATEPLETFDPNVYLTEEIPGSDFRRAERMAANGSLMEEGFLKDGKRVGTWVIYHPNSVIPKQVISYVDGRYNGIYLEFNNRGYLELRAEYKENLLDGPWAKYRFGRPTHEGTYVNGKLDGFYREYIMNTGKLTKEISYKNGVIDGPYRFYNEDGEVTLEYEYRNGEKVGGGEIDPSLPNEPK